MGAQGFIRRAVAAAACATLTLGAAATFAGQRDGDRTGSSAIPRDDWNARTAQQTRAAYDTGFTEGRRQGEVDARGNRAANYERADLYRSADRGYDSRYGTRDAYRSEFRRGFATGYRQGYDSVRVVRQDRRDDDWRDDRNDHRAWSRGYQEPASARGYSDGYAKGQDDGRDHDRYDPVRSSDYRAGDQGYYRDYGSKDTYKNNYRNGFRQGYEDGYRDGNRRR
jgi:flagellar biosynthesis/type III secretory pathway protein FliH